MMARWKSVVLMVMGLGLLAWVACAPKEEAPVEEEPAAEEMPAAEPAVAIVVLQPRADTQASGTVTFTQEVDAVRILAEVQGAAPGLHGLHVHATGDCSAPDFTSTGGHFNPAGVDHAGPGAATRHAGDLGNIEIGEDGTGSLELTSNLLTVSAGENSVMGRGVILHEGEDDLTSQPTGAAGGRVACGVVEEGM